MASLKLLFVVALSILAYFANAQFVESLPDCVRDCIKGSPDDNCDSADIKCLCRASAGYFLTDVVICIHNNCDNDLDDDLLLAPIQLVCQLAGAPIPDAAFKSAENEASSLATQATVTVTMTPSPTPTSSILSSVTVTSISEELTFSEVVPITIGSDTTASGSPSTIPKSSSTVPTTSNRATVSHSTITSGVTSTSTSVVPAAPISNSKSSSTETGQTSTGTSGKPTDSAPFTDTNGAMSITQTGNWLGPSILLAVGWLWF